MRLTSVVVDRTFASTYTCEPLTELSSGALARYFYPGASQEGGRDGVIVRVHAGGSQPWLGMFAFGHVTTGMVGIFTTPDPARFCVVSKGAGYVVAACAPLDWEPICAIPIRDVRVVSSANLLVFADFTSLAAYGASGFAWRTKRLTLDDLTITAVTPTQIFGVGADFGGRPVRFIVDVLTGSHEGGIAVNG